MTRLDSIARYRDQALNAAAVIAAIATARLQGHSSLRDLSTRQDDLLPDLLHDMAFKARKWIELAIREDIPVMDIAERRSIPGDPRSSSDEDVEEDGIAMYSLWFVLGRIIHSDKLVIERGQVPFSVGDHTVHHEMPWGFVVQSDKDMGKVEHFIFIEFLLEAILAVDNLIQHQLLWKARLSPE